MTAGGRETRPARSGRRVFAGLLVGVLALAGCQGPSAPTPPLPNSDDDPTTPSMSAAPPPGAPRRPTITPLPATPPAGAPPAAAPRVPAAPGLVGGPDFTRVFDQVAPSVVGVAAGRLVDGRFEVARSGTGFVLDGDGNVVTNAHIIGDAARVRVRDQSGRVTRARLVGLDLATDLAVLAPGPLDLPPVAIGDPEVMRPGAWVAAIGNPHGMEHSITVGVISALGRRTLPQGAAPLGEYIQSDVALDPGSSGGPLVDAWGQVIGLNTAIVGSKLSFSIRVDMVLTVARRLLDEGEFVRGFAGLYVMATSAAAAATAGLGVRRGVRVRGVVQDGPAHAAGLTPGDVILRWGDREVDDPDALPWLIAATRPGAAVVCEVARGAERLSLTLTMGEAQQ